MKNIEIAKLLKRVKLYIEQGYIKEAVKLMDELIQKLS